MPSQRTPERAYRHVSATPYIWRLADVFAVDASVTAFVAVNWLIYTKLAFLVTALY